MEQISYHVERKEYPCCTPQRALVGGCERAFFIE